MVIVHSIQIINSTGNASTSADTIFVDAQNSTVNIILPAMATDGTTYKIKRIDTQSYSVYILGSGGDTVANASSQYLDISQCMEFIYIDSLNNWELVANQTL